MLPPNAPDSLLIHWSREEFANFRPNSQVFCAFKTYSLYMSLFIPKKLAILIWGLVAIPRYASATAAGEEVQVGPLVGLHHVVEVELVISALEDWLRRLPFG